MKCPYCSKGETKVVDSRLTTENSLRRRRECLSCEKRFTTYERIERTPLLVIKKDGTREQFDKDKIKNGLLRACEKRPISLDKIELVVNNIENDIFEKEQGEVSSKRIGEYIMKQLKKLDKVAYIRFASVYREFTDLQSFEKELKSLLRK